MWKYKNNLIRINKKGKSEITQIINYIIRDVKYFYGLENLILYDHKSLSRVRDGAPLTYDYEHISNMYDVFYSSDAINIMWKLIDFDW